MMLKLQSAVLLLAMLALAMARATSHRGQMHRGPDINARSGPGLAIRRSPLINQPEKAKVQWEEEFPERKHTDTSLKEVARTSATDCNYIQSRFDVSWAALMAKLDSLAYVLFEERDISSDLQSLGLQLHAVINGDAKGFIAYLHSSHDVVVVFKGTTLSNTDEILTDLNLHSEHCDDATSLRCHAGFVDALDSVYSFIKQNIWGQNIYITGHSLGAGLACILTYRLTLEPDFQNSNLITYTFGCPYVGDRDFATAVGNTGAHIIMFNDDFIANIRDPVYRIPFGWRPTGELILPHTVVKIGNAPSQLLSRKLPFTNQDESVEAEGQFGADTHQIGTYISVLEGCSNK